MKLALELTNKEVELKTEELNFIKMNREELKQKLAIYEKNNEIELKTNVNKNLIIDSDDENDENNISLSELTDKEKNKDDKVDDLFFSENDKKNLEFMSTTNHTDGTNIVLDAKDYSVPHIGEDSYHSDL